MIEPLPDIGTADRLESVAVQPDGKILVGGYRGWENLTFRAVVFRLNPNGTFDTTFGINGILTYSFQYSGTSLRGSTGFQNITILPNDRILLAISHEANRPGNDDCKSASLLRFESNGLQDMTFGTNGLSGTGDCHGAWLGKASIKVLSNSKIVLSYAGGVAILSNNGSGEKWFRTEGSSGIAELPNGRIVVGGDLRLFSENTIIGNGTQYLSNLVGQINGKMIFAGTVEGNKFALRRLNLITSQGTRVVDYNNDYVSDLCVYRADNKTLYCQTGLTKTLPTNAVKFIPEYNESAFFALNSGRVRNHVMYRDATPCFWELWNFGPSSDCITGSLSDDMPVGGDFDGDGITKTGGYFRPSNGTWYPRGGILPVQWGTLGDKPVPADYDYDGMTDYAVYRPSNGTWYVRKSSDNSAIVLQWGNSTDIPLTGDFDADGKADFTVYRASEGKWYQYLTTEGVKITQFGLATDSPVPGDYDGDGRHDIAIYRNGNWWLLQSRDGLKVVQWGTTGDVPVSVRYDN